MFKKYISYFGVLVLACFSFYYTGLALDVVKSNDPIMKSIMSNSKDYYVESVSAVIDGDSIIPGINGKKINVNKSYQKMKKHDVYDESLYVFSDIIPDVTIINNYDKYIVRGNDLKNEVALLFKVDDFSYIESINKILLDKNVVSTFFIDGALIENNIDRIGELVRNNYEIENLGYDLEYTLDKFGWTNNLIESISHTDPMFCYTDYKNSNILDLCSGYRMYTVKPTVSISNYPFSTVKKNLENGNIISFSLNNELVKELPSIISYIKQKGYKLVTLRELISENLIEEK